MQAKEFKKVESFFSDIIRCFPQDIKTIFIHGSTVTGGESCGDYYESDYFLGGKLVFSLFIFLKEVKPDVDIIVIGDNLEKITHKIEQKFSHATVSNYRLSINLISSASYRNLLKSRYPLAPKLILLFKKKRILFGAKYLDNLENLVRGKKISLRDYSYHREFCLRKELMRKNKRAGKQYFILDRSDYVVKFPTLLLWKEGEIKAGFQVKRVKLVYPKVARMESKTDLNLCLDIKQK